MASNHGDHQSILINLNIPRRELFEFIMTHFPALFEPILLGITRTNQLKTSSPYIPTYIPLTKFSSLLPVHQVPSVWNSRSNDMILIQNINILKSRLKKSFIKSYSIHIEHGNNAMCSECPRTKLCTLILYILLANNLY